MAATTPPHSTASSASLAALASGSFIMLSAAIFLSPFALSDRAIQNDVYMGNLFLSPPLLLIGLVVFVAGLGFAGFHVREMAWGPALVLTSVSTGVLVLLYAVVGGRYSSAYDYAWPPYLNELMMVVTLALVAVVFIVGWTWGSRSTRHAR